MQPSNGLRGYSEFFTSGFRAVLSRARRRPSSTLTSSTAWLDSSEEKLPQTLKTPSFEKKRRRSRTASLIITSPTGSRSRETKHSRRSSLVSTLSTRLFDRLTSSPSPSLGESSGWVSSRSGSSRNSRIVEAPESELPDVWITTGGPFTPMPMGGSPSEVALSRSSIDPFSPSPDSKPFYIDFRSTSPVSTPKGESFLSLSGSSPDPSFLSLPQLSSRRERPTSVQTMPLPTRSRRSSFQYRPPNVEKRDESFWIVEEEDPSEDIVTSLDHPNDLAANLDWREFHLDLLLDYS